MQNDANQSGQCSDRSNHQKNNSLGSGTGSGTVGWRVGVCNVAGWPEWTAVAVRMTAPLRAGRGDIGLGGGRGAYVGKGTGCRPVLSPSCEVVGYRARASTGRASTAGGALVTATQAGRARVWEDERRDMGGSVALAWRVPYGTTVEPSAVAGIVGGLPAAVGGAMAELQGQHDLSLVHRLALRLAAAMRRDGRDASQTTMDDAASAGLLALARWRAINARHLGVRIRGTAGAVAWRAIVREVSRDGLGESVQPVGLTADPELSGLIQSCLPLPPLRGDETRADRASRLRYERTRARRGDRLAMRLQALVVGQGANGERRRAAVERVGMAVQRILAGHSLETAAIAAGYHASGTGRHRRSAGDALLQAARRLGCRVQFSLRVRGKGIAKPERLG